MLDFDGKIIIEPFEEWDYFEMFLEGSISFVALYLAWFFYKRGLHKLTYISFIFIFLGLFIEFFGEFVDDDGMGEVGLDVYGRFFLIIGFYLFSIVVSYFLKKQVNC